MKKYLAFSAAIICMSLMLTSCGTNENPNSITRIDNPSASDSIKADMVSQRSEVSATDAGAEAVSSVADEKGEKEQTAMKMNVQIGAYTFTATLENNDAVQELAEMMRQGPVTIAMDDYAGFEKVGPLGRSLTTSNSQTTTAAGDIVLYNGNNIVMFYGSNSWSYTRIGKIDDLTNWKKALGSRSVTAIFTLAE
ncbi:MAG: hypothetical protein K2M15_10970 [Oscillospiraceae bacterium]|nr:hypothetical protein [Oscillospiraceae bacterium]